MKKIILSIMLTLPLVSLANGIDEEKKSLIKKNAVITGSAGAAVLAVSNHHYVKDESMRITLYRDQNNFNPVGKVLTNDEINKFTTAVHPRDKVSIGYTQKGQSFPNHMFIEGDKIKDSLKLIKKAGYNVTSVTYAPFSKVAAKAATERVAKIGTAVGAVSLIGSVMTYLTMSESPSVERLKKVNNADRAIALEKTTAAEESKKMSSKVSRQ